MEKQFFSNNKFRIFLFASAVFLIIGGSVFYLAKYGERRSPSSGGNNRPILVEDYKPDLDKTEVYGFPIYSNAKFIKKERHAECGAEIGLLITYKDLCDSNVYTWETTDDFDAVEPWYQEETSSLDWNCIGTGTIESYMHSRDAYLYTECEKENIKYGFSITSDKEKTKILLQIPDAPFLIQDWKTFESKEYGFSLSYPESFTQVINYDMAEMSDEQGYFKQAYFNVAWKPCDGYSGTEECFHIGSNILQIHVYKNSSNLSLESWIRTADESPIYSQGKKNCFFLRPTTIEKNSIVSGENAVGYEFVIDYNDYLADVCKGDRLEDILGKHKFVFLSKNQKIYSLSILGATEFSYPEFEKMLYTFKLQ